MKCTAFRSSTRRDTYLIIPFGKSLDSIPKETISALGQLRPFKELELDPNRPIVGLNAAEAAINIQKHGFHLQQVGVSVSEHTISSAHFNSEPGLKRIAVYSDEHEPVIRLLEVNANSVATGTVDEFSFSPQAGIDKKIRIADITPEEWEKIEKGEIPLPEGWPVDTLKVIDQDDEAS